MRKARLGFKIYSLDDELLVEEAEDFVWREEDKKIHSARKDRARKLRCYNKHKERYNANRRERAATVKGKYKASKQEALRKNQEWLLTQEEWEGIWLDAGFVALPGTQTPQNPRGVLRTAFSLRGPASSVDSTMMGREDMLGPWSVDNCYIIYRKEPLVGSVYHYEKPNYINNQERSNHE